MDVERSIRLLRNVVAELVDYTVEDDELYVRLAKMLDQVR